MDAIWLEVFWDNELVQWPPPLPSLLYQCTAFVVVLLCARCVVSCVAGRGRRDGKEHMGKAEGSTVVFLPTAESGRGGSTQLKQIADKNPPPTRTDLATSSSHIPRFPIYTHAHSYS